MVPPTGLRRPSRPIPVCSTCRRTTPAINYKTGKIAWRHRYPGTGGNLSNGFLTTAGKLVFAGEADGNIFSCDAATGKILWHSHMGNVSNAPETYMLDGHQYLLVAAGDQLFTFNLY